MDDVEFAFTYDHRKRAGQKTADTPAGMSLYKKARSRLIVK